MLPNIRALHGPGFGPRPGPTRGPWAGPGRVGSLHPWAGPGLGLVPSGPGRVRAQICYKVRAWAGYGPEAIGLGPGPGSNLDMKKSFSYSPFNIYIYFLKEN